MRTPTAEALLSPARQVREATTDMVPMLTWALRDANHAMVGLVLQDDDQNLYQALDELATAMASDLGPARWIAFTADSYARRIRSPEDLEPIAGGLAAAFAEGDPGVVEQLYVALVTPDEVESVSQNYRHTVTDGWEWDEPIKVTNLDADLVEIMVRHMG